jgi:hypothetical protein
MSTAKKTTTLAKPTLSKSSEQALAFAVAKPATTRVFHAPEGYRRLTINLTHALHKKLKQAALDNDCTATEIVEKMLMERLG